MPNISSITHELDNIRSYPNIKEIWGDKHTKAFYNILELLIESPILNFPNFNLLFYIATNVSNVDIGAVLYQLYKNDEIKYISFQARSLSKSERNYSAIKKELLVVIFVVKKFHYYIWGRTFKLYIDHTALVYLNTQKNLNPMMIG